MQEIFTLDATNLIIRFSNEDVQQFNEYNDISIDQLRKELSEREIECYFQKVGEEEQKIIIPVPNDAGHFEVLASIHHEIKRFQTHYSYRAILEKRKKTAFNKAGSLPDSDFIKENCSISIVDIQEDIPSEDELRELMMKVHGLNIASTVNISDQQNIWDKYIQAQQAIIENLQTPFEIKGEVDLQTIKKENGDIVRYLIKLDLRKEILPEYRMLEQELADLGVNRTVDSEGNIFLTKTEVEVLDAVLQRKFSDRIERDPAIVAIIQIRPERLAQKIERLLPFGIQVSQNSGRPTISVSGFVLGNRQLIRKILQDHGFEFRSYRAFFKIINHGNILENKDINQKHGLTFGKRFIKAFEEREYLLPYPRDNVFSILKNDFDDIKSFYSSLSRIYGRKNIVPSLTYIFEPLSPDVIVMENEAFSDEFWIRLRRELYKHEMEEAVNQYSKTISLEFTDEATLAEQIAVIQKIEGLDIVFSPQQDDFKFKVKTNIIAKKTDKELFYERLKLLGGTDFGTEIKEEGKRYPRFQYLGTLNSRDSTIQNLVLTLPFFYQNDKKRAKEVLKFLKGKPVIQQVRANLSGDLVKIQWLREAVKKITVPSETPNGRPVNERLGDFIFDSSKATPVFKEIGEKSDAWWKIKNNELLPLNESQRKAVLAAVHCEDLALLQGPPGTGKTTVIAEIIWQIISRDPAHKILLTSETNLAVDNALDRLLNEKGLPSKFGRYTTLIKPLRFGKISKMDEEGKKYSLERIAKWMGENYEPEEDEPDEIDEKDEDAADELQEEDLNNNAVQDWMKRIAARAQHQNPKYANVLKDWTLELAMPVQEVKKVFTNKYFEYANVVGSTCSSSGSPGFMWAYANAFSEVEKSDVEGGLEKINFYMKKVPFSKIVKDAIEENDVPANVKQEFNRLLRNYRSEYWVISQTEGDRKQEAADFATIDGKPISSKEDVDRLLSYHDLREYSANTLAKYFEPRIQFDTVIMDEASKATPPELLLPLCYGRRSIIIGDHRQLPPMLNEKEFKEALLEAGANELAEEINRDFTETSQFERLILNSKVPPTIISNCNIQYRMHPDINDVIRQFYLDEGGLEPAPEIMNSADDPNLHNAFSRYHGLHLPGFITPRTHTVWVNVSSPEIREGTSVVNPQEADSVRMVIEALTRADGFQAFQEHWTIIKDDFKRRQEQQIGVISFYGAQKRLLRKTLKGLEVPLKINTVDRFQGMERNIVIVSTVRSNLKQLPNKKIVPNKDIGFAKSPQRLNVALSRARRLLIVVGNKDFFYRFSDKEGRMLYKNAIDEIARSGSIIESSDLKKLYK